MAALPDWLAVIGRCLPLTHGIAAARAVGRVFEARGAGEPVWSSVQARARDLNWMQVEEYVTRDDRVVLPVGSTEQHGYLSLETDNILAERVSAEAADPLAAPVLPVLAYGLTPDVRRVPGQPDAAARHLRRGAARPTDPLHSQGFRRLLARQRPRREHRRPARSSANGRPQTRARRPSSTAGGRASPCRPRRGEVDPEPSHANWFENFPWTRLAGVELPPERKPPLDEAAYRVAGRAQARELLGDGVFSGAYELPDDQVERVWSAGVAEVREILESGWPVTRPTRGLPGVVEEARAGGSETPEAMTLATADAEGRPSARDAPAEGRRRAPASRSSPATRAVRAASWRRTRARRSSSTGVTLGRQVRVEGTVRRLSAEQSDAYWATRPPRSRAAAAASRQSEPIESREALEAEFEAQLRARGGAAAGALGWLPARARGDRALAASRRPAARPHQVHARARGLAFTAALAVVAT